MQNKSSLRIHPAIGIARVGNSTEYYLGPETMAAEPQANSDLTGGLPIKPGTEDTPISSNDLRDANGKLKKQAARFKIYQYEEGDTYSYPAPAGSEVVIGSTVDGKVVKDIIWTVHLANKKANCWEIDEDANEGINLYKDGKTPPLRNPTFAGSDNPATPERLKKLVIDAGPRAIQASTTGHGGLKFDEDTPATYWNETSGKIETIENYPKTFPASDGSPDQYNMSSQPIKNLGEIYTEDNGRLLVLGAFGLACGFDNEGNPDPNAALDLDVDNDNWLDDTADGPVQAVLVFGDDSTRTLEGTAWAISTDPAYAPQTLNVVSLWDNVLTTWLEQLNLNTDLYSDGKYNESYHPVFKRDVFPIFNAAHMQMWNTNLPGKAIGSHKRMYALTEKPPIVGGQPFKVLTYIRNPNDDSQSSKGSPLMPLSLGDFGKSFLTVTTTQYFFLSQWDDGKAIIKFRPLSAGEQLDKTILVNCLGGRFSPGIDMTFIVTDVNLYNQDWKNPAIGTFRINAEKLDYTNIPSGGPFLGVGYIPLRTAPVQPGDLCKFMAIPWHTDYNSCATHTPAPNPGGNITEQNVYSGTVNTSLFWSWPAQRPVAVYTYKDLANNNGALPRQRYSVRGEDTAAVKREGGSFNTAAMNVGRFQDRVKMLEHWHKIGTVIQGPAIDGYDDSFDKSLYLEVQSQFDVDESNLVVAWPNTVTDKVYPPKNPDSTTA